MLDPCGQVASMPALAVVPNSSLADNETVQLRITTCSDERPAAWAMPAMSADSLMSVRRTRELCDMLTGKANSQKLRLNAKKSSVI
jgi:hypothetical protein